MKGGVLNIYEATGGSVPTLFIRIYTQVCRDSETSTGSTTEHYKFDDKQSFVHVTYHGLCVRTSTESKVCESNFNKKKIDSLEIAAYSLLELS